MWEFLKAVWAAVLAFFKWREGQAAAHKQEAAAQDQKIDEEVSGAEARIDSEHTDDELADEFASLHHHAEEHNAGK